MTDPLSKPTLSRRRMFAGAGTVGALAAAAAALPLVSQTQPVVASGPAKADDKGGYLLTEHVQRYYRSARI